MSADTLVQAATASAPVARPWLDEWDGYLTCTHIVDVTHDVKSFTFELPGQALLAFLPGQYLTFRFLIHGQDVQRCYTISSAPTRPEQLEITTKRVPGGIVSNWMHDHLRVGDAIGVSGPFGRFSSAIHAADRYLFLTAGSGITPAMSMMRTLRDAPQRPSIVFVHCARTPADIIYRDEIEAFTTDPGATVAILCEDDDPAEQWPGPRGRLTTPALLQAAPDLLNREIFTCGPPPYMQAVREMLSALGVDPARAHEESFDVGAGGDLGTGTMDAAAEPAATGTMFRVHFRRSGQIVECDTTTSILEAGTRAGIALASSCEEGMCGTCKLTLLSGRVDMQHAGGIRPREIEQQKILACCSTPVSDVEVDA